MNYPLKSGLLLTTGFFLSSQAYANTLIDVGVGSAPNYAPSHGTSWTLSSQCSDINENGEAACQTLAIGPTYGCGFRNSRSCSSKVIQVSKWDGSGLVLMSDGSATYDVPSVINNLGEIGGYAYMGAVYPAGGGNGRIWSVPGAPVVKETIVTSLNDQGDYILQDATVTGGYSIYTSQAYYADGTPIELAGIQTRPMVIGNNGELVGGQIIQNYASSSDILGNDEIPEISGAGWLLSQNQIDALPLDEAGLIDLDGMLLWPTGYYRESALSDARTSISDINDFGEFVYRYNSGGKYYGNFCTSEGETLYTDVFNVQQRLPWICDSAGYVNGYYAGGKAFIGINNIGDAVGIFTPGVNSFPASSPTHPWVWLKNASGGWDEYNANDLLPANSGYTVVSVADINDQRQIVGTCKTENDETRGCIINVTDQSIPADTIKPDLRIANPLAGDVSGTVSIDVKAWDRESRMRKVVFKIDNTKIGQDTSSPYSLDWDTSASALGPHTISAVAIDNAGNRRTAKVNVTVVETTLPPTPPPPPPAGTDVEGEGIITALFDSSIQLDNTLTVVYDENTAKKFNDVTTFQTGLPVQYKGAQTESGEIVASDLEIN